MVFTGGYPIVWIHAGLTLSRKIASCICDTLGNDGTEHWFVWSVRFISLHISTRWV